MQRRGGERRQFVRVADEVVVAVTPFGDAPAGGRTLNFSLGGVLLASERRLDVGTDVEVGLRVDEPDGPRTIEFTARVVRCRTLSDRYHELALEFAGGSAADQLALQELIARRMTPDPVSPRTA